MDDDYVNEDCPNMCNVPHSVPPESGGEEFICTETDERFFWCDECNDWLEAASSPHRQMIETYSGRRVYVCDVSDHEFTECDDCMVWLEVGRDTCNEPCYSERTFCDCCWETRGGCDCEDCRGYGDEYDDEGGNSDGEDLYLCRRCNTFNRHLDLMTEMFMCDCAVKAILESDPEHPIRMYGEKVMA